MTLKPEHRIFVALDTADLDRGLVLARALKGLVGGIKIGKEFFTALGPEGVRKIQAVQMPIFLDLKLHDIPNTVAGAVRAAIPLRPAILNVHAAGGRTMMEAARDASAAESQRLGVEKPVVLAVTVLTSLDADDLADIGVDGHPVDQVKRLAALTQESGLDGVVCSANEIEPLRDQCGPTFKLLTPGIRPAWALAGDQKRMVTPADAVVRGSDYLVIGRPITGADDPAAAARRIGEELNNAG
ncbi:MAG: orotidine-5'-phosphate decarboxylase [Rhodospirillales bacterium]|nr:orotidine-5'-phosphate decarboxylase [Rhodospirillales bacterium]